MSEGEPGRRVIDGRFELQARLGGGGMGTVWRAQDLVLDRAVALKEVRPPDPGLAEYDPEAAKLLRARVLREARALARVDHPNVVTIHHVVDGGEHTYPWLVMELVTGGSLADRLARGTMEPREAARLGRELLAALRVAHAAGIQHRDVKPANVLLRPDGRPVLTDFGIAAIRESTVLTMTGSVIGTPDYMAPERISGAQGGPESDFWSLAMMLYVAVEGNHPLQRGSTLATLAAVLSEPLPPPRQAGVLTPVLDAVLVKDAALRPGADAIEAMLLQAETQPDTAPGAAHAPAPGTLPPRPTDIGATSYNLAPPQPGTAGPEAAPADAVPDAGPPSGFGPPSVNDAPPSGFGPPSVNDAPPAGSPYGPPPQGGTGTPPRPGARDERARKRIRRMAVGSSVVSTVLVGVVAWSFLPDGGDGSDNNGAKSPESVSSKSGTPNTPDPTKTAEVPAGSGDSEESEEPGGEETAEHDLLNPEGIRTAVAAIKKASGTNRMANLSVYQEYVLANVMVDGSDSRWTTWSYWPDRGATNDDMNGSVTPLQSVFVVDDFNWDAVPGLFKRAEKELNVKDETSRYINVEGANPISGDPMGMTFYIANDFRQSGHLVADNTGKVLRAYPNEGD
ncbi:protein kinase [Streptomyces sp. NPDC088387]|uniref:serine/threonine-protein kinase n=1 Tax=Streptomyces sp. NPDC088387 TaxID=3365859 RepID=UPI0037F73F8C